MEENIQTVVIFLISAILLFIFPVYVAYEKKDDVSYALALKYTQDFVENVGEKGYLTLDEYNSFKNKLTTTGNMYDIELEHKYTSVIPVVKYYNPNNTFNHSVSLERHKAFGTPSGLIAKETHEATQEVFSVDHINNTLNNIKIYTMNEGDVFSVRIKNTNITLATLMYNLVSFDSNNTRIYVNCSETVTDTKWYTQQLQKYSLDKTVSNKVKIGTDKFILNPNLKVEGGYHSGNPQYFKENYRPETNEKLGLVLDNNYTIEMKVYPIKSTIIRTTSTSIGSSIYNGSRLIKYINTEDSKGICISVGVNGVVVYRNSGSYDVLLAYKGYINQNTLIEVAVKDQVVALFIDGERVDYRQIAENSLKITEKTSLVANFGGPTEEYGMDYYKEMDGKNYRVYPTYIKIYKTSE